MWSYVGKRVGLAVIGFFAGAAEAMVGLVDSGASLIGFHPDLEGKIAARYTEIMDVYSESVGIDHNLTHDAAIGRFGGRPAENLATGKAIGQLGKIGVAINVAGAGPPRRCPNVAFPPDLGVVARQPDRGIGDQRRC